jgi:hypothetical protein
LKIENVEVKSYVPVNDLQTCGSIHVAKTGRVVARIIQSGEGINCEGTLEGMVHTDGPMALGAKATWKGAELCTKSLHIEDGAKILGHLIVPWTRPADERKSPTKVIGETTPTGAGADSPTAPASIHEAHPPENPAAESPSSLGPLTADSLVETKIKPARLPAAASRSIN